LLLLVTALNLKCSLQTVQGASSPSEVSTAPRRPLPPLPPRASSSSLRRVSSTSLPTTGSDKVWQRFVKRRKRTGGAAALLGGFDGEKRLSCVVFADERRSSRWRRLEKYTGSTENAMAQRRLAAEEGSGAFPRHVLAFPLPHPFHLLPPAPPSKNLTS
jgi:hypothetical protein